ncbi:MAG: acyl-CoA thioesterase [Clostridium sp.]|nr:acyl-CoA thioesterase [Clostridium sp.]
MKKITTYTEIEVEFYDLDPMNVVWHGNYIKYIEKARCDLLEKIGYTYDDMRKDNVAYPVATMDLKFIKSALFKQKLIVETTLESLEPALLIRYLIKDKTTGEKLFKAKSMQIGINIDTRESIYTPPLSFIKKIEEF